MKTLRNKLNSDKADSALIIFLLCVPLLLIVMGFVSDLNKNVNAKAAFNTAAQESAQSAVRTVDTSGSLNKPAIYSFIEEYERQSKASSSHTSEISSLKSDTCSTVTVNGVEHPAPYIQLSLSAERGSKASGTGATTDNYISQAFNTSTIDGARAPGSGYKVINAQVYDVSTNDWGLFGLPNCQTHHSTVSAVAFGSNEDL